VATSGMWRRADSSAACRAGHLPWFDAVRGSIDIRRSALRMLPDGRQDTSGNWRQERSSNKCYHREDGGIGAAARRLTASLPRMPGEGGIFFGA